MLYTIGLWIYSLIILLATPFSARARQFRRGRKLNSIPDLQKPDDHYRVWFHVSSLGEYHQGKPLIHAWRKARPSDEILLSFFSPSGFNHFRDHALVDHVFYLLTDYATSMEALVKRLNPSHFVLVKYDFWPNLMGSLIRNNVKCYLVSALFHSRHYIFRMPGRRILKALRQFSYVFVQDDQSLKLLKSYGVEKVMVAGDTRVDGVMVEVEKGIQVGELNQIHEPMRLRGVSGQVDRLNDSINSSWAGKSILVGGSTWPVEERILQRAFSDEGIALMDDRWRLILAPHDLSKSHQTSIRKIFGNELLTLSSWEEEPERLNSRVRILLIDRIGWLMKLYRLADLVLIGGGFGKGIHNILEPAAYGVPVVFGPHWNRFREAHALIEAGAAYSEKDKKGLVRILEMLFQNDDLRSESGAKAANWISSQRGASDLIMNYLLENS